MKEKVWINVTDGSWGLYELGCLQLVELDQDQLDTMDSNLTDSEICTVGKLNGTPLVPGFQ